MEKNTFISVLCLLFFALGSPLKAGQNNAHAPRVQTPKTETLRQEAQYLSTNPDAVEDTCPGNDILKRFSCTKDLPGGYTCFDVSMVQGDPIPTQRYDLLQEKLTSEPVSAEPQCLFTQKTCNAFLENLNYNLDFSWFITNFPTSSFTQCNETYSCTRVVCFFPAERTKQETASQKLSCVYKKNQLFFVGANITCQSK